MKISFHIRAWAQVRIEDQTRSVLERIDNDFTNLEEAIQFLRRQVANPMVGGIQMTLEELHQ